MGQRRLVRRDALYPAIPDRQPKEHLDFYKEVAPDIYAPMNSSGHVDLDYLYALH
jgi:hypothetical protein